MSEEHFTRDEDLLERFVLDRLTEEERRHCENHLRRCETCQQAVREEQRFAAGAKRLGRDQLKGRIRNSVGFVGRQRISWRQVAAVAAALVIVAGIGVVFRWWQVGSFGEHQGISDLTTENRPAVPSVQEKKVERPSGQIAAEPQAPSPTAGTGAKSEERHRVTSQDETAPRAAKENVLLNEVRSQDLGHVAGQEDKRDRATNQPQAQDALDKIPSKDQQILQQFWVRGTILPGFAQSGPSISKSDHLKLEKAKSGQDREVAAQRKSPTQLESALASGITVNQQRLRALPSGRQQQVDATTNMVETLVRQENGQTFLTLYLDSLLDDNDVLSASVEYAASDSVILHISDQRIIYKMPQGWNPSQGTRTGITK